MAALTEIIRGEIAKSGPICFARFMELALYCPEYGYYETEGDKIGRRGDYFTSVSVGSLFGELLGRQFVDWVGPEEVERLEIVEAGAHDGRLAGDILGYIKQERGELFERVRYLIVEPSEARKGWQQRILSGFGETVRWVNTMPEAGRLEACETPGCKSALLSFRIIFSNELLDSIPVHRVAWDAREQRWMECRVGLSGNGFQWIERGLDEAEHGLQGELELYLRLAVPEPEARDAIVRSLPHGYVVELCPAARAWWRTAAQFLGRGKLLTFDYGLAQEELLKPERMNGTLRTFRGHHAGTDLLAKPGEHDLTSHLNFGALIETGESCGLTTDVFLTQERFLTGILSRLNVPIDQWSQERRRQFMTLTHPQQLGNAFRVLVQSTV